MHDTSAKFNKATMLKIIGISGKKGSGKSTLASIILDYYRTCKIYAEEISFADNLKTVCSIIFNIKIDLFIMPFLKERHIIDIGFHKHTPFDTRMKKLSKYMNMPRGDLEKIILAIYKQIGLVYNLSINLIDDKIIKERIIKHGVTPRTIMQTVGTEFRNIDDHIWINIVNNKIFEFEKKYQAINKVVIISDIRYINEYNFIKSNPRNILIRIDRPRDDSNTSFDTHNSETELDHPENRFSYKINNNYKNIKEFRLAVIQLLAYALLLDI